MRRFSFLKGNYHQPYLLCPVLAQRGEILYRFRLKACQGLHIERLTFLQGFYILFGLYK